MMLKCFFSVAFILLLCGCQTMSQAQKQRSNTEDAGDVLSVVAGALSGKTLNKEEIRNLEKQIRTDEEAQTAIEAIADSVGGKMRQVKYCPVTGQRYASHFAVCPEHQVALEIVSP